MLCRVTLLVLTCSAVQAWPNKCGPCDCDKSMGYFLGIYWNGLKFSHCLTANTFTSVPDTSILPADTEIIHLQDQNIPTIKQNQFISFNQLQIIRVQSCKVSVVESHAFRNMINVIGISLYDNLISTLPTDLFSDMPNLKLIDLGTNKLKTLQGSLFLNLKQLEWVYLYKNKITSIDKNCFVNLPRLSVLELHGNKLSSLNSHIINKMMGLKTFKLGWNPWHCDIMLCKVMNSYVHNHLWDDASWKPNCASPAEVAGKQWKEAFVTMCNSTTI